MKIKLHNSLSKFDKSTSFKFLFDRELFINLKFNNVLWIYNDIDDYYYFLRSYSHTKKFEEGIGFGKEGRNPNSEWWKDSSYQWKEMSE